MCTAYVEGMAGHELWGILKERAHKDRDGVVLVGPWHEGRSITAHFKPARILKDNTLDTEELCSGRLKAVLKRDGMQITFDTGEFPDNDLFWQTVDSIVLEIKGSGYKVRGWLAPNPPMPKKEGKRVNWDPVFEWYYRWQEEEGQRMTVVDLAAKLPGYTVGYVRQKKADYDAEHHE